MRIQTVIVRTITPDSVFVCFFVCLSLVATLFFMLEQI